MSVDASTAPHCEQCSVAAVCTTTGAVSVADGFPTFTRATGTDDVRDAGTARPHSPQNMAPTGNSVPQFAQVTVSSSD
jgi:hypothetical protein